jgi:hypothetical protein
LFHDFDFLDHPVRPREVELFVARCAATATIGSSSIETGNPILVSMIVAPRQAKAM